jgi:hypothetical protein
MGRILLVFPSELIYGWLRLVFVVGVRSIAEPVAAPGHTAIPMRSALVNGAHAQVRR